MAFEQLGIGRSTVIAAFTIVFGGAILLVIILVGRGRLRLDRHSLLLAAAAALSFAFDMTMWNRSIRLVGPGLATILVGCQVFPMAGIGLVFGREKLTWRLALAVPCARPRRARSARPRASR